jgi:hypothetical protein
MIGGLLGAVAGLFGATYLAFTLMGDGQAVFAGFCFGIPVGGSLGALVGWLIVRRIGRR